MSIGIFGGTFNPVHYGHLRVAEEVRESFDLEKVLFIPSGIPPLKSKDIIPALHRYEMVRLATMSNPWFEVSDMEIKRGGVSYTVDTLTELRKIYNNKRLYFITGIDSFSEFPGWYMPQKIMELTEFIVVTRPGFDTERLRDFSLYPLPYQRLVDIMEGRIERFSTGIFHFLRVTGIYISGSMLRELIKKRRSIKYLLPDSVESYIINNRIFLDEEAEP